MRRATKLLGLPLATALASICGCNMPGEVRDSPQPTELQRRVTFTTTEFTRPYIDVSPDGSVFYFDALGEIYRAPIAGGEAVKLDLGPGWKTYPNIARDGERIAFLGDRGEGVGVWGMRISSGGRAHLYAEAKNSEAKYLAWISDGQVASTHRRAVNPYALSLSVSEVDESGSRISLEPVELGDNGINSLIGAANDGRFIYFVTPQGIVKSDVRTGLEEIVVRRKSEMSGQFRVSGDGALIGYAQHDGVDTILMVYDQISKAHVSTECMLEASIVDASLVPPPPTYAFLADGRSVLLSRRGKFYRCDFSGATNEVPVSADLDIVLEPMIERRAQDPQRIQIRDPAVDRNGKYIAFTARGGLWTATLPDGPPTKITQDDSEGLMPAFSPDGSRLAYVVQKDDVVTLRVRDLTSGSERIILESPEKSFANPAWSPDGGRIAYVEVDQKATLGSSQTYPIMFVDVISGQRGTFGASEPRLMGPHLYARPSWSAQGDGIYYLREERTADTRGRRNTELVHQILGAPPVVLLTFHSAVGDVVVSPGGRYVAIQDGLGLSIAPLVASMAASPDEPRHLSLEEIRTLRRIPVNGADYVWWTTDDQLLWSVQDQVFLSNDFYTAKPFFQLATPAFTPEPEDIKVYAGGRIITMGERGVIEDGVIVTSGPEIRFVGPTSDLPLEFSTETSIDVSGKTIIPGLIDVHLHRSMVVDDFSSSKDHDLFASAGYGVTSVFDPSIGTIKAAYLHDISRDPRFRGASFYGSGQPLLGDAGHGWYVPIKDIRDARGYMERFAEAGFPLAKVYLRPSRQERKLIAQAAREFGLGVTSHEANRTQTILGTVQDGFAAIEHELLLQSAPFYADVVGYLKDSEVSITPTMSVYATGAMSARTVRDMRAKCLVEDLEKNTSDDADTMRSRSVLPELQAYQRRNFIEYARMLNEGVRITIGGHNAPAGLTTHWEMWSLVAGGGTPMNVLRAATVYGATKLNMQNRIGSIAEGMDADFVVLNSNPLDSIYNTTDISRVVRRGHALQWPEGNGFPQSWRVEGNWASCQAWNLGVPRNGEISSSALN